MGMNMIVYQMVNEFKRLDEVVAITLAGSCASGRNDNYSDIDIDIITEKEIPADKRLAIIKKFADELEVDNNFWGTSDEFILRNSSIQIDIAYFDIQWLKEQLENVMDKFIPAMGYTTCFWHNVIDASIVYDKKNEFTAVKNKYKIPFPKELKQNIIRKNHCILRDKFSSYYNQIERAIKRRDLVNLNNRITAFLESYFDIIFAVNELPHPGEKRLVSIVKNKCTKIPNKFEENIDMLFRESYNCDKIVLITIKNIIDELDNLLRNEKIIS